MPDWYPIIRACAYMKWQIMPWELAERSVLWQQAILAAESAENEATEALQKQAQAQQG